MGNDVDSPVDERIAARLKGLRQERGWSLDELAERSTVSRATLSRLENGAVSPTASVLGRLCAAFGITLSRLMVMVEDAAFQPLVRPDVQPVWQDPEVGFRRRSISPPARELSGEVLECRLDPATRIDYPRPPRQGLEHHLYLLEGRLEITLDGVAHDLEPGDCLRYRLFGSSSFATPKRTGARYLLFMV